MIQLVYEIILVNCLIIMKITKVLYRTNPNFNNNNKIQNLPIFIVEKSKFNIFPVRNPILNKKKKNLNKFKYFQEQLLKN